MTEEIANEFKEQTIFRLEESSRMMHLSLEYVKKEEVWKRPNENSNSIGNLILHLCGNITQYAISSLGQLPDARKRDEEFSAKDGMTKDELLNKLDAVVEKAKDTIKQATTTELMRKREVQGFTFSGIGIVMHVVEHYSYHTGQVAFWTKQLREKTSLGFYDGMDLNIKNNN